MNSIFHTFLIGNKFLPIEDKVTKIYEFLNMYYL